MKCQVARFAVLAVCFGYAWSSCVQDGSCKHDGTALLQTKHKHSKVLAEAACNWVQYLGDNTMCKMWIIDGKYDASKASFSVADEGACQMAAEAAGHEFYQYTSDQDGKCNTEAVCDSPQTDTPQDWKIFQCKAPIAAAPPPPTTAAPTAAACNWVRYLGDNTKCEMFAEGGKWVAGQGAFDVADQAACQKAAEDAGDEFYQYLENAGQCNTKATCDNPTATDYAWEVFQCQAPTAAAKPAAPTAACAVEHKDLDMYTGNCGTVTGTLADCIAQCHAGCNADWLKEAKSCGSFARKASLLATESGTCYLKDNWDNTKARTMNGVNSFVTLECASDDVPKVTQALLQTKHK